MKLDRRHMSGQLLMVWILAMLAAHGIAVLVMSWWRADHLTVDPVSEWVIESHTAAAYRLAVSGGDTDALLESIRLPDSVFRVAEGAAEYAPAMDEQEENMAGIVRQMLELPPDRAVRVRLWRTESARVAEGVRNWLERALGGEQAWRLDIELELPDGRMLQGRHWPEPMPAHWNQVLTFSLLVGMIPAVLIAIFFGRRIVRPLGTLTEAARRFSRGEQVRLPPVSGPGGVREITQAFNDMQESLMRFVKGRTLMLAAIGHDLRTPLTSLRIRVELVEDAELRQAMIRTLDEMQLMLEETLKFARDDALKEPTQEVSLNGLVLEAVADHRMQGRDVRYASQLDDGLTYRCRPVHLKRAVNNLIDNAARYGTVEVRLSAEGPRLRIEVLDRGPGIAPDQLEQVFEPFVRLDPARSQQTGGAGLGLTIAHSCARAHGGDVVLRNRDTGGLSAVIELPA